MARILLLLAASITRALCADPCKLATASTWVSSKTAHACELNVPFNRTRSLAIVDTAIKSLAYYSLETWFQHSPNSKIPHDVDIRSLLQAIENTVSSSNFSTDWDFNIAVTDAFNREQDGHTVYVAACTEAFSWNLPFSISTLAATPSDPTAFPVFLVNYDFPNQDRHGLEAHYKKSRGAFLYTQEVGRFGQRSFYPGAHSVTVRLQTAKGVKELEIPWAATFTGKGNTTESFITQTCSLFDDGVAPSRSKTRGPLSSRRKAVVAPDTQPAIRAAASATHKPNYVQPNWLKKAGVKHVLLDISGNRGGYIAAGAIAMWSLWPQDLYPGFPAVYRADTDLIRRQAAVAADKNDAKLGFMDPPVAQTINGALTNFSAPPFAGKDYVLVSNGICASTCSILSSYLFQKHRVRSAVFGGAPNSTRAQFDGGVKGSEVTDLEAVVDELDLAGLGNDTAAPRLLPIAGSLTLNFRNAIPYIDKGDEILEYVWEQATRKYQFTHEQYNSPQKIWEFVAEEFFGDD
ncbi:hypothetical protein C8R46DRAFT_1348110 [Mycena filopes]|nr:hypothetical protein C8R46DRAFT_1348110 [Mycena filopes]